MAEPYGSVYSAFDDLAVRHFRTTTSRDFAGMILGAEIGIGQYRRVWSCELNDERVFKVETGDCDFSNVQEWDVWQRIKDTKLARWFAPCYAIGPCGVWLLQHRTTALDPHHLPKRVPAFFTDLKLSNWGRIGDRVVCHDYGNNLLMENGMTSRMRVANWSP